VFELLKEPMPSFRITVESLSNRGLMCFLHKRSVLVA